MPIISSSYKPPFLFKQADIATIYSGKVRKVLGVTQKRHRLELSDGDFLDVDWSYSSSKTERQREVFCHLVMTGGVVRNKIVFGTVDNSRLQRLVYLAVAHGGSGSTQKLYHLDRHVVLLHPNLQAFTYWSK